jgi:hypothetical protein
VALGVAGKFGRTLVHASAEWFDAVRSYEVLSPAPFYSQTSGERIEPRANDARKNVLNAGIGLEHRFSEQLEAYAAYTTDFTAHDPESDFSVSRWDIHHVTVGTAFNLATIDLTLGVTYSLGDGTVPTFADLPSGGGPPPVDRTVLYDRIRINLGFSLSL